MATYDIHIPLLSEAEQTDSGGKLFSFGFTSAIGVKGPQKLINRWLKCLLTLKGTDLLSDTYGTGFPELINSNIGRRQDFVDAAALFIADCNNQITAFDQAQFPPDDERLESAVIDSITPRGDSGYDIYVTIKNVAGALLTFAVPTSA